MMIAKVALALGIGMLGGFCAHRLHVPLPWMIGPLLTVSIAAYAGIAVSMWSSLRDWMIAIVGILIGGSFTPDVFDRAGDWMLTLLAMVVCTVVMMAAGTTLLQKGFGLDRATASLAGAPGTLTQMIAISVGTTADVRAVSFLHTIRLTSMVLLTLPLLMAQPGVPQAIGGDSWQPTELLFLGACLLGFPLARRCGLPSAALLGPAFASALAHYFGFVHSYPPAVILALAQLVIAVSVGARFHGVSLQLFAQLFLSGLCLAALLATLSLFFAVALYSVTDSAFALLLLAVLPGGTSEMVVVAVALSLNPAFVASHHLVRMIVVTVLVPLILGSRKEGD